MIYLYALHTEITFQIVMEFCGIGSMGDIMQVTKRSLTEPELATICRFMLEGLQYLHEERNQIHRDIKPDNVLLNAKGEAKLGNVYCSFLT